MSPLVPWTGESRLHLKWRELCFGWSAFWSVAREMSHISRLAFLGFVLAILAIDLFMEALIYVVRVWWVA